MPRRFTEGPENKAMPRDRVEPLGRDGEYRSTPPEDQSRPKEVPRVKLMQAEGEEAGLQGDELTAAKANETSGDEDPGKTEMLPPPASGSTAKAAEPSMPPPAFVPPRALSKSTSE